MASSSDTLIKPPSGASPELPRKKGGLTQGTGSATGIIVKLVILGLVTGIAIWAAFILVKGHNWIGLAVVAVVTAVLFLIYLTPKRIPAKYLVVGTLFLIAFQIVPVLYTVATAFTNFGDGHRGSKQDAITAVESSSVKEVPNSTAYVLSVATDSGGSLVMLLSDTAAKKFYVGTPAGLTELSAGEVTAGSTGKITKANGYSVLLGGQAAARGTELDALRVPTQGGAIKSSGISKAYELVATQVYDAGCDCVTDKSTGAVYKADNDTGYFVAADGKPLAQGWKVNVGFSNFGSVLSNKVIRSSFFSIIAWNFAFAILTPGLTFILGLFMAMVMNNPRLKGQRIYRSLLILPYAMPGFAMLLIWRDMFNTDFGLINKLTHLNVDWFGTTWGARIAVLLIQLWMGYPYMFLICTGALQSIPADLSEAAQVDGAKPFKAFRTITFPLLLVATGPLLIASFASNFNNFGAIFLTSEGGPFPADNPSAGATDLLISYTFRLAFGTGGARYGFAAAISIFIFIIVAAVSYLGFRRTKVLEEIN